MSIPRGDNRPADRAAAIRAVLHELRALSTAMDRLDQLAAQHFGLNRTDLRSLDIIGQAGGISPTELAKAVGISTSAVTTVIDRLERAGYAYRARAEEDRRRTVVRPTLRTAQLAAKLFDSLIAASTADAEHHSNAELVAITDFLARHRKTILAELEHSALSTERTVAPPVDEPLNRRP